MTSTQPLLEIRELAKQYGNVLALRDVSMVVRPGEVTCVLGDNGAGKSTLIKMLSGVTQPDQGEYLIGGEPVSLSGPRAALDRGIATVFQDLAMIPLLSITRNFFLGNEPTKGRGPLRRFDRRTAATITREQLATMGIAIRDPHQPVGTLSGGERQSVAIARAIYFGAKVLILDEPTSALGVKQAGVVLRYIIKARDDGVGVIFITHNPHHAYPVGDHFVILNRGRCIGTYAQGDISREELVQAMSGGRDLDELSHELQLLTSSRRS
jgi:simple sugar transport system ATP-binding protein